MAETIIKKVKYTSPRIIKTPCKKIGHNPNATNQLIKKGKKKIPTSSINSLKYTKAREKKRRTVVPKFSIAIIRESQRAENTPSSCTIIKYRAYSKKNRVITNTMRKPIAIEETKVQLCSSKLYPHQNIYAIYTGFDQNKRE